MSLPSFRETRLETLPLQRLQASVKEALAPLLSSPIASGRLVEGVELSATTTRVPHGLGREWRGFQVTRIDAAATVYEDVSQNDTPGRTLPLKASVACTVSLYVF